MSERRPWGTGSVSRFRGRWRARLPGQREDVGIYDTREQAASALALALAEVAVAPLTAPTFAAWGSGWLGLRGVRDGTLERDRARWRCYVDGSDLGAQRVGSVTTGDVERWLADLSHLAAQTRQNALGLVKGALAADAKARGVTSPASGVTLPKGARARHDDGWDWLRQREIERVILATLMPKQRAFFTLAIFTGMRAGELCGLRWEDVDVERGIVHVRRSRGEPTKSGKPREVPMLLPARAALERWRAHYDREHVRSHLGLVFPAAHGGYHDDGYDADWPEVRAASGLRQSVTFHDLRHTFASHALQGTWAPRWFARALRLEEVRDLLGHADIATTQRYAHLCRDGVHALVAQPGHNKGHSIKPPPRFELGTYGLRKRPGASSAREEDASIVSIVPHLVSSLAAARDRLLAALEQSDPWRDHRALDLVDAVDDVIEAMERPMSSKERA